LTPLLFAIFIGLMPHQTIDPGGGSIDVMNLVVPTSVTWLRSGLVRIARKPLPRFDERTRRVLWPAPHRHHWFIRLAGASHVLQATRWCSYGGRFGVYGRELRVAGLATMPMPSALLREVSLLNRVISGRLILFAFLGAAVVLALWTSSKTRQGLRIAAATATS
jgi:hypothetical protein